MQAPSHANTEHWGGLPRVSLSFADWHRCAVECGIPAGEESGKPPFPLPASASMPWKFVGQRNEIRVGKPWDVIALQGSSMVPNTLAHWSRFFAHGCRDVAAVGECTLEARHAGYGGPL